MTRKFAILAAAALLLTPAVSHAEGVILGARLGYAAGMGDIGGDSDSSTEMGDWTKSNVPLQLELLFKATPQLAVGPYFSYGWAQVGGDLESACDTFGVNCSASIMRLGVEAIYTFHHSGQFIPWMGAGIGYEWSKVRLSEAGESVTIKLRGWEFLNVQAGGDFSVAPGFRVGPFVQLSLAQYSTQEIDEPDDSYDVSDDIPSKKVHQWLQLGVRGSFDL